MSVSSFPLVALVFCAPVACIQPATDFADTDPSVLWGEEETGFPYVLPFGNAGWATCTGTLVGPRLLVTAAHCVLEEGLYDPAVVLGETVPRERVHIHPRYQPMCETDSRFDIALVELEKDRAGPYATLAEKGPVVEESSGPIDVLKVGFGNQAIKMADRFCTIDRYQDRCEFVRKTRKGEGLMTFNDEWSESFEHATAKEGGPPCPRKCTKSSFRAQKGLTKYAHWKKYLAEHCAGTYMAYDGYSETRVREFKSSGLASLQSAGDYLTSHGDVSKDGTYHGLGGGDSGGPMFLDGQFIGVAANGYMRRRDGGLVLRDNHVPLHNPPVTGWLQQVNDEQDLGWSAIADLKSD